MSKRTPYYPISNHCTFAKVMNDNPDLCKAVIERMLRVKVSHIQKLETEAESTRIISKSVRFDVFVESAEAAFEVEMQTTREPDLGLRMRYYQSHIDRKLLPKGTSYRSLKPVYIVFICLEPPFPENRQEPEFRFRMLCPEHPDTPLNDKTTYVIFNAAGDLSRTSSEIAAMLNYVKSSNRKPGDQLIEQLEFAVEEANRDERWVDDVATFDMHIDDALRRGMEDGYVRGEAIGYAKGESEGFAKGESEGYAKGESEGFAKGESAGFAKGESEGFAKGESAGFAKGESAGFAKGEANRDRAIAELAEKIRAAGEDPSVIFDAIANGSFDELFAKYSG